MTQRIPDLTRTLTAAALLAALLLFTALPAAAAPADGTDAGWWSTLQRHLDRLPLLSLLAGVDTDAGSGMDPNGSSGNAGGDTDPDGLTTVDTDTEAGSGMDPDGSSGNAGGSMDPNG